MVYLFPQCEQIYSPCHRQLSSPTGLTFPGYDYEHHGGCLARSRNSLPFRSTCVHSRFLVGSVMFILFLVLHVCFVLRVSLSFYVGPFVSLSLDYPFCLTLRFLSTYLQGSSRDTKILQQNYNFIWNNYLLHVG